jgi:hypothetical protein
MHQVVIPFKRFGPIWTEIVLLPVYLDVPDTTGLSEEWLWKMRHDKPSSQNPGIIQG